MNKRAQISGQIFIYILAAIIIGVVLLIGYRAISTIMSTGEKLNIDDFAHDLETTVAGIAREFDSITYYEFTLHRSFDEICFVDAQVDGSFEPQVINHPALDGRLFIRDSLEAGAEDNVFLLSSGVIEQRMYLEKLDVDEDVLCLENEGLLEIGLQGKGKKAILFLRP